MEFVKTINGFNRMCALNSCDDCPLKFVKGNCLEYLYTDPISSEELISKWLETNPSKTYLSEVLKHFPETPLHPKYGFPIGICPHDLGQNEGCIYGDAPISRCADCWNTEVL